MKYVLSIAIIAIFYLLFAYGSSEKTDAEQELEDIEQMEYLHEWSKRHRKEKA